MVKYVKNRIEPILDILKDKKVLDIGCIGMGKHDTIGGENWLFGKGAKIAEKIVGIDINREGVKKLQDLGYDVRYYNAEVPFDLGETFNVVTAEEVIEHLSNLTVFLENVKRHLKNNGFLIITTPNSYSHVFLLQKLIFDKIKDVHINEHTHWHSEETLRCLLTRHGFEIVKMYAVHPDVIEKSWWSYIIKPLWKLVPKRFGRNIICVAKKKGETKH